MKPPGKQKKMDLWDIVKIWIELEFCDKESETNKQFVQQRNINSLFRKHDGVG
jgi:hypothetical protein